MPIPRRIVDAEVVLCAAAEPEFGWSPWFGPLDEFPGSTLLALEAVQAARTQSEAAAEGLDLALRHAYFARSRCITMRHEVLPDGSEHCNPGVRTRWTGTKLPQVVPRVVSDDPSIAQQLVARAAGLHLKEDHHDHGD